MILSKKIAIYFIFIGSLFVGYYFEENLVEEQKLIMNI